ncbi:MAG TPA: PAS domain S-box protein [Mucilaginibacter sp.]|jgi:PAS domain S-box-containing protein
MKDIDKLRYIFDLSPDLLCQLTADGNIVMANKALTTALGYINEELLSKHYLDFIHPEDKEDTLKQFEISLKTQTVCVFMNRFRCADGQYKWLSWNINQLPDKSIYASARDVIHHKDLLGQFDKIVSGNRHRSLIESEENYKLLFYSSPQPILIFDRKTMAILDANQAATELYGYTIDEFLTMVITDLHNPEELHSVLEEIKKRKFHNGTDIGIRNHVKKNGEHIKVDVKRHYLKHKGINCMIVIFSDVTEKTSVLRSLQTSNERFEYVTKATSEVIWDWNLMTDEVYYSDNIKHLFGHIPGTNKDNLPFYFEHVHPEDRERVILYTDQVKYGNMINWTEEYRFKKTNGEYAFVLDKGIVIRDENGVGTRMIGAMQDITIFKQNEFRITHQNEQLMEIARINAHEIRKPVASILGLFQLFNKKSMGDKANGEILGLLEVATHDLDEVIRRIIGKTAL